MYLDLAKAQELINAAVTEKGAEYVYPHSAVSGLSSDCKYVEFSSEERGYIPSCIVGHALITGGLDMVAIRESGYNESGITLLVDYLVENELIDGYDDDALAFLARIQNSQDRGRPWGEAVEKAKEGYSWSDSNGNYVKLSDSHYI